MWGAGNHQLRKEGGIQAAHTHTCSDLGNGVGITQAQSGKQNHDEDYTWELACTPLGSVCKVKVQRRTLDREQGPVTSQPAQSRGESEDCRRSGSQVGLAAGAGGQGQCTCPQKSRESHRVFSASPCEVTAKHPAEGLGHCGSAGPAV